MRRALLICAALGPLFCQASRAATITARNDGISIDAGTFGRFVLSYPALDVGTKDLLKPIEVAATSGTVRLRYAGGTRVDIAVASDGTISYTFVDPPPGLRTYRMEMLIDFGFSEGGKWRMGAGSTGSFPKDKPAKPHLFQGNENTFVLTNFEGKSLSFEIPPYSYAQLTDNREWNWKIFSWMFAAPFDRNSPRGIVKVSEQTTGARSVIIVDRFGQDAAAAFPGKVGSEEELRADIARDNAYYGSLRPPATDPYGGLAGSRARLGLKRTGFFHVEKLGGRWLLVDPAGNAYFHLGICGFQPGDDFTYIKDRRQAYEWLPAYESQFKPAFSQDAYWSRDVFSFYVANLIRKYGRYDPLALQTRMVDRVRKLGFNGVGAFSGESPAYRSATLPWVSMLPLGTWSLGGQLEGLRGLFDPFDQTTAAKMDNLFARSVAPSAGEPLLIGYFLENEQAFEDIPRVIPRLKGTQPAKRMLVQALERRHGNVAALNAAWNTKYSDFAELLDAGLPVTTKAAAADMEAFTGQFIDAYYRLIRDTFRKYDRNHMLLGNRWQPGTANSEQLCRIAGKYCEMLSLNYYTYGIDKAYLRRLYDWSGGRPFMLSEFYWASPSESGLPGGSEVKSQRERGLAYRTYVEQASSTGIVVGIEWFILIDQARTGRWFERYNGERANAGLFSVADRPYRAFLAEAMKTNYTIYDVLLGQRPPFAWDDPRFQPKGSGLKAVAIPRAAGPIKLDGTRVGWPGTPPETVPSGRVVTGAEIPGFDGSYRMCWDDKNLYVMVVVNDPTPVRNERTGADIWNGDAIELFIGSESPGKGGPLLFTDRQVLLSAGSPPDGKRAYVARAPVQVPCQVSVIPAVSGKGYVLVAAIPFEAIGFVPKAGQVIRFDLAIDDGDGTGRQRQLMWCGGARNSGDRTDWGRATFAN